MTEAEVIALMVQAGVVLTALFGMMGLITVAKINGRIDRLKDAIVTQHDEWAAWADAVLSKIEKLPGGKALIATLPARPRLHLHHRGTEDIDE